MHNNSVSCPQVSAALILREDKILIARRPPHKAFGLYWEFPGGKTEPGESLQDCLRREIREELSLEILVGRLFHHVRHRTPALSIDLYAFWCRLSGGELHLREHVEYQWTYPGPLKDFLFTEADVEVAVLLGKLPDTGALSAEAQAPSTLHIADCTSRDLQTESYRRIRK